MDSATALDLVTATREPLPRRAVTAHRWANVVFLHWRVPADLVAPLVPPGTRPDLIDGDAWVGLLGYEFLDTTVPPLPPPGPFAHMTEIVVEIPTVDDDGRPGVAYRTVETQHLPAVLAARTGLGVPYTFAHAGSIRIADVTAHRSRRPVGGLLRSGGPGAGARMAMRARSGGPVQEPWIGIATALTTRPGIHARHLGSTNWWRRRHEPWALLTASVEELRGDLLDAVGVPGLVTTSGVLRAPDSALMADAVEVAYAWGGTVGASRGES